MGLEKGNLTCISNGSLYMYFKSAKDTSFVKYTFIGRMKMFHLYNNLCDFKSIIVFYKNKRKPNFEKEIAVRTKKSTSLKIKG